MGDAAAKRRDTVIAAAQEFNAGRYFEAHEALEDHLDDVPDDLWDLFVGLIQISVAYHKISQGLHSGALAMFKKALKKIEPFAANDGGVRLEALRQRAREDLTALEQGRFDAERFAHAPPRLQPLPQKSPMKGF